MLLAETTTGEVLGVAGLGSLLLLVGGGAKWLWDSMKANRRDERTDRNEDEATAVTRLEALLKRVDADRVDIGREAKDLQRQIDDLREKLRQGDVKYARTVVWIRHLEYRLTEAGIPHKPWSDSDPLNMGPTLGPSKPAPETDRQPVLAPPGGI